MTPLRWTSVMVAGAALSLPSAFAQEPEPEASPAGLASPSPGAPRWAVHASVQETNESNPALADAAGGTSWATSLRAGVTRTLSGARTKLSLSAQGSTHRYHDLPSLNETTWSAAAAGEARTSARTTLKLEEAVTSSYVRDLQTLLDGAGLLPTTVVLRSAGSVEAARRLSSSVTLAGWARHEHAWFDSDRLQDGGEWSAGSTATFASGPRRALALTLSARRSHVAATADTFYASSATWKAALGRRVKVEATLGAVYGRFADETRSLEPEGRALFALSLRRVAVSASYGRLVGEAFGYGLQRRADVAGLEFDWNPSSRFGASTAATYGSSRQVDGGLDVRTRGHAAEVHWMAVRGLTVATGYNYLRRYPSAGSLPVSSHGWSLSLSFGRTLQ